jgi:hypothetical protein
MAAARWVGVAIARRKLTARVLRAVVKAAFAYPRGGTALALDIAERSRTSR